jgi:(R,R)-butanediol dehydrogenase/meso-butanediol dehydrogenase/diacetyl reductase
MLAALLHGNRDLRVEEQPEPEPGPEEVKLAVAHNGLCGTDLHEHYPHRWVGPEVISPETAAMAPVDAARVAGERVRNLVAAVRAR